MREKLPSRRNSVSRTFTHTFPGSGPREWTAMLGEYEAGEKRFGEVFLEPTDSSRSSVLGLMAHEGAILLSIALQHGATVEELRTAMTRDESGAPHSVIGAVLDLMAAEAGS